MRFPSRDNESTVPEVSSWTAPHSLDFNAMVPFMEANGSFQGKGVR